MRTNIDKKFLWRLALIAVSLLGISLWFLYDGTVTYPRQRERALKYEELKEEDRLAEWTELAEQRGWPDEDPGEAKSEVDILFQLIISGLAAGPGFLYLVFYVRARGKWIEVNENQLSTSWGRQFQLSEIVLLNKKKWDSKGIAKVSYQQNGRKRRVTLDDWKFEAEPTRAILREIESHIDDNQIVGGARDPVPQDEQPAGDAPAQQESP